MPKDLPEIQKIQNISNLVFDYGAITMAEITEPNSVVGVAETDGKIVGFIVGEKIVSPWTLAHYFAIIPEYRGTSVFLRLGKWFIKESKNRGAKHILAYADKDNEKLLNFYKRFDFKTGGTYIEVTKEI